MKEGKPILVQYVFLDIVGFTKNRTIEAQVDIVNQLNLIISDSLTELEQNEKDKRIFLPTGDGVCIALIKQNDFDMPLNLSLLILEKLFAYNESMKDKKRKFEIRIGINHNIDNIITDINENLNVAGRGINTTQRIMSLGDGNQILIGSPIYDILCEREAYLRLFKKYNGKDKHGNSFDVYQFIKKECVGLNINVPSEFAPIKRTVNTKKRLSIYEAHMIANAIKYHSFFYKRKNDNFFNKSSVCLLQILSDDSQRIIKEGKYGVPTIKTKYDKDNMPTPTYRSLEESNIWTLSYSRDFILEKIAGISDCFEKTGVLGSKVFVNKVGEERLKSEQPEIYSLIVDGENVID